MITKAWENLVEVVSFIADKTGKALMCIWDRYGYHLLYFMLITLWIVNVSEYVIRNSGELWAVSAAGVNLALGVWFFYLIRPKRATGSSVYLIYKSFLLLNTFIFVLR